MIRIFSAGILLLLSCNVLFGQLYTFTSSNAILNLSGGATVSFTVSGVPAGSILRQVNLKFGDGSASYSASIEGANVTLRNPASITKDLITTSSLGGGSRSETKWMNITLRDHPALKTPYNTNGGAGQSEGYPYYYGYYAPAETWAAFNSSTINGNWTLTVNSIGSTTYQRKFNKVELVFGPAFNVIDVRGVGSAKPNESCATRQCIETSKIYWAKNTDYASQNSPAQIVDGCRWNGDDNNKSWFYFVASGTTAEISVSGFNNFQQSVVVKPSACGGSYSLVAGGCMSSMFGSLSDRRYYNHDYATGSGSRWNHGYSLTGLVVGQWYALIVEGSENRNAEFYIEISAGATGGCSALPISLKNFSAEPEKAKVDLSWETASERNNDYFTLFRSADMLHWTEIAKVEGAGNSNHTREYHFTDYEPLEGIGYYKLKQTDFNGEYEEFEPVSVHFSGKGEDTYLVIQPNPASQDFEVIVRASMTADALLNITDLSGRISLSRKAILEKGVNKLFFNHVTLSAGAYMVNVLFPDGSSISEKMIIE